MNFDQFKQYIKNILIREILYNIQITVKDVIKAIEIRNNSIVNNK